MNMEHEIIIRTPADADRAAEDFLSKVEDAHIIAFYAPMGAGKTTFISAMCRCLGVREDAVGSPTFAIINEYRTDGGRPIYHFDFYRISKLSEALDVGFYDYLDSGELCLIEWPENVEDLLPEETMRVEIAVLPDGSRRLAWSD